MIAWCDIRAFLFATFLTSLVALVTSKQTETIPMPFPPYGASVSPEFTFTSLHVSAVFVLHSTINANVSCLWPSTNMDFSLSFFQIFVINPFSDLLLQHNYHHFILIYTHETFCYINKVDVMCFRRRCGKQWKYIFDIPTLLYDNMYNN